ncbi:MAG: hypothetical protein GY913_31040 [Proteobacteria bacterium]|nr:hypothetical protein [Pseudomonadota bacterium]MCP4921354.1 hypothetical protein [Pseudomonadota bacterium]
MATSRQQRKLQDGKDAPEQIAEKGNEDQQVEFQGPDVEPDQARGLQESVGNQALTALLNEHAQVVDLEVPEVDEEVAEEAGTFDFDEAFSDYLAAIGARERLTGGYDAEDWAKLFGGDADEDPPPRPPKRVRIRHLQQIASSMAEDVEPEPPLPEQLEAHEVPPLGAVEEPAGDEVLDALWAWLRDPLAAAGDPLEPEDLMRRSGPLERCEVLGRFAATSCGDPVARALGRLARPLPGPDRMSSQVARAASLAQLACLVEGRDLAAPGIVNRAAAIALEDDADVTARIAARQGMATGKLAAPRILDVALEGEGRPILPTTEPARRRARGLLERALRLATKPQGIPDPPRHARAPVTDTTGDDSTAAVDALLGVEKAQNETVAFQLLSSTLEAADELLLLAGRTQVELAAAGIAAVRGGGQAPEPRILALLTVCNRRLRQAARSLAQDAQELELLDGTPYDADALGEAEDKLIEGAVRLRRIRDAALSTLADAATGNR